MQTDNTTENVFRFVQIRPAAALENGDPTELADSEFARRLADASSAERQKLSLAALADEAVRDFLDNDAVGRLLTAWREGLARDGTVADLAASADMSEELPTIRTRASDLLLGVKFASTGPPEWPALDMVFRAASALEAGPAERPLSSLLRRPLKLPAVLASRRGAAIEEGGLVDSSSSHAKPAARVHDVLEELAALARAPFLNHPIDEVDGRSHERLPGFVLNERGRSRLTESARELLANLDVDAETETLDSIIQAVEAAAARVRGSSLPLVTPPPDPPEELPYIRDVGVADLLVVKQHLKAYERADIAHVENVLIGETKSRTHRALERTEETITVERETTRERETELETAERFELNRETARTVQRDQEFGFGLTVSGKYGPSVEYTSSLQGSSSTSSEESVRSATRYAKDVVERSLERVVERVREEQVRKILREQEETNLHELKNETDEHISGVYQFLEKVYESQIFNYGIRQMFDFMVPEPASYLWYLEKSDADVNLPTPPPRLDDYVTDASGIDGDNVLELAARFQADGVEPPPPILLTVGTSIVHGQDAPDDGEEGQPRSILKEDVTIPVGYRPYRALVRPLALTDEELAVAITVGHTRRVWRPLGSQIDLGGLRLGTEAIDLFLLPDSLPFESQSKLPVQVVAYETNSYSVSLEVIFLRTPEAYRQWQIKTYDKLAAAYQDNVARYEALVADLKAAAEAQKANATTRFGAPPSQNLKTIKAELKKHCISIVTRQRYEDYDFVLDGDPPYFDFDVAAERGSFTRFFEQAFEWDQLQYVCYPYYWSHRDRWSARFLRDEVDPALLEFLQAGAARVVVPVRPGFEIAVTHYLETQEIWNGEGEPPPINDPLYVPIVTEIQERTGAPQGELPVGDPWSTRVPTPLAILRREATLPAWTRPDPEVWDWQEV